MSKSIILNGAIALLLTGCSGGASVSPAVQSPAVQSPAIAVPVSSERVALSFEIDDVKAAAHNRSVRRVSGATQLLGVKVNTATEIYYNVSVTSPNCNTATPRVCTLFINALPGSDSFRFQTFADLPNSVNEVTQTIVPNQLLDEASLSQTIVAGHSNTLAVTLNGVPQAVIFGPLASLPGDGANHSEPSFINVVDNAGFIISGTYDSPVILSVNEAGGTTTGNTTLSRVGGTTGSTLTFNSSSDDSFFLNYNGGGSGGASPYHVTITDNFPSDFANKAFMFPIFVDNAQLSLTLTTQSGGNDVGSSATVTPIQDGAVNFTYSSTCNGTPGFTSASISPASPGAPPFTVTATATGTNPCVITFVEDGGGPAISTTVNVTSVPLQITIPGV